MPATADPPARPAQPALRPPAPSHAQGDPFVFGLAFWPGGLVSDWCAAAATRRPTVAVRLRGRRTLLALLLARRWSTGSTRAR